MEYLHHLERSEFEHRFPNKSINLTKRRKRTKEEEMGRYGHIFG